MSAKNLTPEQEKVMEEFRQEWLEIGSCCEPADRPLFEATIAEIYRHEGFPEPEVLWYLSPIKAGQAARLLKPGEPRPSPHISPFAQILKSSLLTHLGDVLEYSLRKAGWPPFRKWGFVDPIAARMVHREMGPGAVRPVVTVHPNFLIWDRDPGGDFLKELLNRCLGRDFFGSPFGGQLEATWVGYYLFAGLYLGVPIPHPAWRKLQWLAELARSACAWWPCEDKVVVSERPSFLNFDEAGRLHAEGRAALEFRDGSTVFAWHGVEVPAEWGSTPRERWKAEWLFKTENAEVRRILIEALGYERIMEALGGELIHAERDMELREIRGIDVEPVRLLKVVCPSTARTYVLRVPPYIDQCEPARRWTFGDYGIEPIDIIMET
jgi:hypothetical protein